MNPQLWLGLRQRYLEHSALYEQARRACASGDPATLGDSAGLLVRAAQALCETLTYVLESALIEELQKSAAGVSDELARTAVQDLRAMFEAEVSILAALNIPQTEATRLADRTALCAKEGQSHLDYVHQWRDDVVAACKDVCAIGRLPLQAEAEMFVRQHWPKVDRGIAVLEVVVTGAANLAALKVPTPAILIYAKALILSVPFAGLAMQGIRRIFRL